MVVCLGRIAFDGLLAHEARLGHTLKRSQHVFAHAAEYKLPDGLVAIASYHPSLQNTNTGKLTRTMFLNVLGAHASWQAFDVSCTWIGSRESMEQIEKAILKDVSFDAIGPAPQKANNPVDHWSPAVLLERAAYLRKMAKLGNGSASETLKEYPQHIAMLSFRSRSGEAEVHERFADLFIVLSGAATLVTGGTVTDAHMVAPGEMRGTSIDGGAAAISSVRRPDACACWHAASDAAHGRGYHYLFRDEGAGVCVGLRKRTLMSDPAQPEPRITRMRQIPYMLATFGKLTSFCRGSGFIVRRATKYSLRPDFHREISRF